MSHTPAASGCQLIPSTEDRNPARGVLACTADSSMKSIYSLHPSTYFPPQLFLLRWLVCGVEWCVMVYYSIGIY